MNHRLLHVSLLGCALLIHCAPADAQGDKATPGQTQLASECVVDPEIWQGGDMIAWQNYCTGTLWTAPLDPATGDWILDNGRGKLVAGNMPKTDYTRNAAEWGFSQQGVELHFTQRSPESGFVAAVASKILSPSPLITQLTRTASRAHINGTPFPSKDATDANSRIVFYDVNNLHISLKWKEVHVATDEEGVEPATYPATLIPDVQTVLFKGPRWIPGERALILTRPMDAKRGRNTQLVRYDIDDGTFTQLTFEDRPLLDGQVVDLSSGERFLLGTYDQDGVIVFREGRQGDFHFEKLLFLPDHPTDSHSVTLWEPFEYDGSLYVVAQVAQEDGPYTPSRIEVAAAEARLDYAEVACGGDDDIIRFDPEAYVGTHGVYTYFYNPEDHSFYKCGTSLGR